MARTGLSLRAGTRNSKRARRMAERLVGTVVAHAGYSL
jgi:hypothetical protein